MAAENFVVKLLARIPPGLRRYFKGFGASSDGYFGGITGEHYSGLFKLNENLKTTIAPVLTPTAYLLENLMVIKSPISACSLSGFSFLSIFLQISSLVSESCPERD